MRRCLRSRTSEPHEPRACQTAGVLLVSLGVLTSLSFAADPAGDGGREIYLHGVLTSGERLTGIRTDGGAGVSGADAACVSCHQRSGFGSKEGFVRIPPIAGAYLFHARAQATEQRDLPFVESIRADREPYTTETLARAIREGVDSQGRTLSALMPRYRLSDADMTALIAYLKSLEVGPSPGVTASELHFATITTPEADPVAREGMLNVMREFFEERNSRQMVPSRRLQASGKTMYVDSMFMVHRQWQLHTWELTGAPSSWGAQLAHYLAVQPVLAVISGLGGRHWQPVHDFCERNSLPCLFPNVPVPVESQDDFYSVYLSKGVLLEAGLIANGILNGAGKPSAQIAQIFRVDDAGEAAARVLRTRLASSDLRVLDHALPAAAPPDAIADAVRASAAAQILVLWLRPGDIRALGPLPPGTSSIYVSGVMGGLEHAPLPPDWRGRSKLSYPFDLPEKRATRVGNPLQWFLIRHIPVVDEQVQADTYLACGLVSETLKELSGNFHRTYLIERLQGMIEHRLVTGYYPRLTLGTRQRFASKGGYLVHFVDASGMRLQADSDWMTP